MVKSADAVTTATVRAGRTIVAPVEGQTKIVGHVATPEGGFAPVHAAVTRTLQPGDTLTAPAREVERLRGLGFVD
jgi:hypothetical protein